ncbi:mechanosensitive ion channel family protein [Bacillus sp. AFS017336]|uniref:mechanosensitive ion channel family protein n=1 Tax=Bacillus sp. AFS017336 TaxID=2033489 RepID=UPI000BF03B13|nr:mechanosensitive ion channel family protein [Bacillus sp. AFS017336]PEL09294.1 mechanosensitive ion channel protein MscS [Bacillus sp. AFS017336]
MNNAADTIETAEKTIKQSMLTPEQWDTIFRSSIKIALIIIASVLAVKLGRKLIRNLLKVNARGPLQVSERRSVTLIKLMENIIAYVVFFIAALTILPIFGVEIKGLLVGAGIGGVAIGFGAQSLVKDIISGFFILFEDQFSVGDYIRIQTFEGTVQSIGLKTTKIRSSTGELHIIQNGMITEVTNFSLHNAVALVDISISYEGDIEHAQSVIEEHLETMPDRYEDMVKAPEFLGIQNLGPTEVTLRIASEVKAMTQFKISRAIRKEIKEVLARNNIDMPYPKMVLYKQPETKNENANV